MDSDDLDSDDDDDNVNCQNNEGKIQNSRELFP